jgi:predicted HicB family RNase H-like nuclease
MSDGRGSPPTPTLPRAVNLQMSQALYERLRTAAHTQGLSVSALIRRIITAHLDREGA